MACRHGRKLARSSAPRRRSFARQLVFPVRGRAGVLAFGAGELSGAVSLEVAVVDLAISGVGVIGIGVNARELTDYEARRGDRPATRRAAAADQNRTDGNGGGASLAVGALLDGIPGAARPRHPDRRWPDAVYRCGTRSSAPTAGGDGSAADMRQIGQSKSGAYVVSVPQYIPRSAFPEDFPGEAPRLRGVGGGQGAAIIEPTEGDVIAGAAL